jgi:hypothetical protein
MELRRGYPLPDIHHSLDPLLPAHRFHQLLPASYGPLGAHAGLWRLQARLQGDGRDRQTGALALTVIFSFAFTLTGFNALTGLRESP